MKRNTLTIAVTSALLVGAAITHPASAEPLDREQTRDLITGATGTHYFLSDRRYYTFDWQSDGNLTVKPVGAPADGEPFATGTWRIKEVEKTDGLSDVDVERANAELEFVFCQQLDNMWHGREMCWEVHQVTFDQGADERSLPTQTYDVRREAGAETGAFVITRG